VSTLELVDSIAAAVGALTIAGVTNKTLGTTPQAVDTRECPCLTRSTHEPAFITDVSFKQLTTQGNTMSVYTLNFKYFFAPVGKDRALFATEIDNVRMFKAVVKEMLRNRKLGGAKYIDVASVPSYQTVFDASGKEFHGAVIALQVTEF
jgi:hypothetical protein